ncbi:hypothetical protein, partial [Vibrio parahaemolyticus]|uniref:hypothetical protein n=1 Tax=Vibrio parahaemolyticus TaxID=670 RepID=UPI0021116836
MKTPLYRCGFTVMRLLYGLTVEKYGPDCNTCGQWGSLKSELRMRLTRFGVCDVRSYEALFTAQRVNHLYHQMNLG